MACLPAPQDPWDFHTGSSPPPPPGPSVLHSARLDMTADARLGTPDATPSVLLGVTAGMGPSPGTVRKVPTAQLLWHCAATPPAPLAWSGQQGPARRLRANLAISLLGLDCPCPSLVPRLTMWESSGKDPRRRAGHSEKWLLNPRKARGSQGARPAPHTGVRGTAGPTRAGSRSVVGTGGAPVRGKGQESVPVGISASPAQRAANLAGGTDGQPHPSHSSPPGQFSG